MRQRRVVALRIEKCLEQRHLDVIARRPIIGGVTAIQDARAQRSEKVLGMGKTLIRVFRAFTQGVIVRRQVIDLLNVKNGLAFHEGDGDIDIITGALIGFSALDRIGINDRRAFFALANVTAKLLRLTKGHPDRGRKAAFHC